MVGGMMSGPTGMANMNPMGMMNMMMPMGMPNMMTGMNMGVARGGFQGGRGMPRGGGGCMGRGMMGTGY